MPVLTISAASMGQRRRGRSKITGRAMISQRGKRFAPISHRVEQFRPALTAENILLERWSSRPRAVIPEMRCQVNYEAGPLAAGDSGLRPAFISEPVAGSPDQDHSAKKHK